ncbi:zinc finger MYM-type protein 1-like [Olea europaea var. sylvestris]|uniref:zinc finger MYM-type protein 1-like n=1 Tax=Olea europaea var. sylvestris TaxID=158386 RepID=UPI000C1D3721|nr:zinc finger MYM-type protein 1-like [Olea europaea var. sylvestris]
MQILIDSIILSFSLSHSVSNLSDTSRRILNQGVENWWDELITFVRNLIDRCFHRGVFHLTVVMFTLECLQLFKEFLHELYKSEFEEVEEKDPFNPKMPIKKQDEYIVGAFSYFKTRCPLRNEYQMNRYFQRKRNLDSVDKGASNNVDVDEGLSNDVEFDVTKLPTDPGLRIPILDYNSNIRDEFKEFGSWLEYSVEKDAAYCLYCYLFRTSSGNAHNQARIKCEVLMNQEQHIQSVFYKQSEQARNAYITRLNASIDCVRVLLRQGHSFRGHDESEDFLNPGNFLVQYQFLAAHNEVIDAVTLGNAPHNCKLTSPDVQKDIVNACAIETINVIIKDVGDSLFSILVYESCDVSMKEQMSIVLRFVDNSGRVNERFIGIEHVTSTTALSLKAAIDKVFSRYNLSMSRLRGQGYDGASNMQGKFNGLKTLILNESPCAFYIHCFVYQLQLALVVVAKKNIPITNFFGVVGNVINTVGASSKRCDLLREKQLDFIAEALEKGEILSGRGLNQETTFSTLVIHDVLAIIIEDESCSCDQRFDATNLLELIQRFGFAFNLQLMRSVLGISNELSKALQRKDQDIVNAMQLVRLCKRRLQIMRDEG